VLFASPYAFTIIIIIIIIIPLLRIKHQVGYTHENLCTPLNVQNA